MASATRKKPKPVRKPARKAAPRRPAVDPLAGIDEPDRAAPPLAECDAEALEFIAAIDRFKKEHARPFPSWSEILLIVRRLGYTRR
ncbi:MAG: hypothetical protein WAT39_06610 [Planctomycetota bacterium]